MKNFKEFSINKLKYVFTDIDDTLTEDGQLPAHAYKSLWDLNDKGIHIIPITGRPAGWCEMIARMWPVAGVVGENGALYFCYKNKKMIRNFIYDDETIKSNRKKLDIIRDEVLEKVKGCAIASDQFCRLFDLAVDFCEDVPALPKKSIDDIVSIFKNHGATAKVSSIHVNGWFGDYNKLSMCRTFLEKEFNLNIEQAQENTIFVGDSPNDETMFGYFNNSFAVSNINEFIDELNEKPKYVSDKPGGSGFTEIINHILK